MTIPQPLARPFNEILLASRAAAEEIFPYVADARGESDSFFWSLILASHRGLALSPLPLDHVMPSPTDRRKWARHQAGSQTTCDLLIDGVLSFTALAVRDVAVGGIGLAVDVPVPIGNAVNVQLHNPTTRVFAQRPAKVVYCLPAIGGGFTVGAAFGRELDYDDVVGLC
jgi:hypothetical protein